MRKPPEIEVPPVAPQDNQKYIKEVRRYKVITPLFGGGVEPGTADPITIVRATEVRGQLRFWWRACRGGQYGTLAWLKDAEENLWGGASTPDRKVPSEVQTVVTCLKPGTEDVPYEVFERDGRMRVRPRSASTTPAYGAFPLQPTQEEAEQGVSLKAVRTGVEFSLEIVFPADREDDVRAALWAWETFGGIGARTRRGFGALQLTHIDNAAVAPPRIEEVKAEIEEGLKKHVVVGAWHADVPHLKFPGPQMKFVPGSTPLRAWQELLPKLKDFRQNRPIVNGRPKRSKWCEPEAIRALTDQRLPGHVALPLQIRKFPRAAFGLPIIFHFKDSDRRHPRDRDRDPADTILQGDGYERLASRLILRPLACANNTGAGLAIVLAGPRRLPGGLRLAGAPGNPQVEDRLDDSEASALGLPSTDILYSFLRTL